MPILGIRPDMYGCNAILDVCRKFNTNGLGMSIDISSKASSYSQNVSTADRRITFVCNSGTESMLQLFNPCFKF